MSATYVDPPVFSNVQNYSYVMHQAKYGFKSRKRGTGRANIFPVRAYYCRHKETMKFQQNCVLGGGGGRYIIIVAHKIENSRNCCKGYKG